MVPDRETQGLWERPRSCRKTPGLDLAGGMAKGRPGNLTSPYLERPLRSLEEARRAKHHDHEAPAPSDSARMDQAYSRSGPLQAAVEASASGRKARRGPLSEGRVGIAILIVGLLVGGVTAWSLTQSKPADQDALARELNALSPAAGPSAPKPTRLIGESAPEAPPEAVEDMRPAPVFRP